MYTGDGRVTAIKSTSNRGKAAAKEACTRTIEGGQVSSHLPLLSHPQDLIILPHYVAIVSVTTSL